MIKLTILHTNDVHGRVSQLSRIAALVREIRKEVEAEGGYCLYVDAGDSEDTTLLESSLTKGSAMNAILRGAGCEFAALGNAIPIRYGHEAISDLAKHFGRPLLCANFLDGENNLVAGLEPFVIQSFGTFNLGIIGVTDPMKTYETFFHLKPQQPDDILPTLIEHVRDLGAQTILLLSHLGLRDDRRVTETVSGIDVLIGGHSHDALNPPLKINETIVAQAGEYGKFLGRLDLMIDPASGKIVQHAGELLPVDESIAPDSQVEQVVQAQHERVDRMMKHVVGELAIPVDLADDRECTAGNLLADALLERVHGAQIALVLAGHWNTGLEAGTITQGALFSANRSTANPAKTVLTGAQILEFMREALRPENAARTLRPLRGLAVGMPHIAGGCVRYSPDLERIQVEVNGQPLEPGHTYTVASTDMEFSEIINYLVLPEEQIDFEVPTIMPEVLEDYITRHSPMGQLPAERLLCTET